MGREKKGLVQFEPEIVWICHRAMSQSYVTELCHNNMPCVLKLCYSYITKQIQRTCLSANDLKLIQWTTSKKAASDIHRLGNARW